MSKPTRIQQAEALLAAFDWDVPHCRQVRDLALQLFDQLQPLHQLTAADRDILAAAALLHDIGWTISHDKHHKHSYRLICESRRALSTFTADEVELIANVARYHRKALPSLEHAPFAALNKSAQLQVRQLASLLRVADGLDRPHLQLVRALHCVIRERDIEIQLDVIADPEAHVTGGARKRELFEETFGRTLGLTAPVTSSRPA
jgi:exopolyphosphatase/guanosine-5'-triphosphate,3'-diphosphate pyrophosphatase